MRPDVPQRIGIGGVPVSAINLDMARETIERWIADRTQHYVCICGAHGIVECQSDADLMSIHRNAGMVTPDGMPVVWMLRALGQAHAGRVYGPDLMRLVTEVSARRGYRQYYYGGNDGVAQLLARTLEARHPGLKVAGTHTPPFRSLTAEEDQAVVDDINASGADIVWVGLSTPKQERWMSSHAGRIDAPVMIGVGAAFDFLAGTKTQAPLWMQRNGLEWFYRLVTEPRRLWRRYAVVVPSFIYLCARQLATARPPTRLTPDEREQAGRS